MRTTPEPQTPALESHYKGESPPKSPATPSKPPERLAAPSTASDYTDSPITDPRTTDPRIRHQEILQKALSDTFSGDLIIKVIFFTQLVFLIKGITPEDVKKPFWDLLVRYSFIPKVPRRLSLCVSDSETKTC